MKNQSKIVLKLVTLATLCLASRASGITYIPHTNIVQDGGFELGHFDPLGKKSFWTQSGNTGNTGVDADSAYSGNYGAYAGPVGSLGYLSQTLHTVSNTTYDLSFYMNGGSSTSLTGAGSVVDFQVFWNGTLIFETLTPPTSYTQFSFNGLLATGSTTELKFGFRNDVGSFHLDDVAAIGLSVPETFSTLWLVLPMAGMIGFFQLRGRRRA